MKGEEALARLQQGGVQLDLLVCDINKHPEAAARICRDLFSQLRPGGRLVMTMKFFGVGRDRSQVTVKVEETLKGFVREGSVKEVALFANTVNERTLVAVRR